VSNELFCGTSATTFSPNTPMTRGMFITVLGRLHGVETNYGRFDYDNFNDVYQGDYFYPYAVWARDTALDAFTPSMVMESLSRVIRELSRVSTA